MDIQYLTLLERILFLLVEFCRDVPGSYCRGCVGCWLPLGVLFCRVELTGSLLVLCGPYRWILPCRMLGCKGNTCWRMPSICVHGMSLVVVVFRVEELILYVEISWSCWIACGNTVIPVVLVEWMDYMWKHHCILYSKID